MNFSEITVQELKNNMDENPRLQILDVREPYEVQIGSIPGTIKIPMNSIPMRMNELIGKTSTRDIPADQVITNEDIQWQT